MAYFITANLESKYLLVLAKRVLADLKSDLRTLDVVLERNIKFKSCHNESLQFMQLNDFDGHFWAYK